MKELGPYIVLSVMIAGAVVLMCFGKDEAAGTLGFFAFLYWVLA